MCIRDRRKVAQYFYPQRQTQVMNEGWACVTGDTLIITNLGLMPAQELVDTQFNGSVEDGNRVVNWFTHPRKPRVRLTTRHGYVLHGGSDHKILVGDRWVELRSLRVGDRVEIRRGQGVFARDEAVIDYDTASRPRLAEVCARQGVSMHTFQKWQSHHRQLRVSACLLYTSAWSPRATRKSRCGCCASGICGCASRVERACSTSLIGGSRARTNRSAIESVSCAATRSRSATRYAAPSMLSLIHI